MNYIKHLSGFFDRLSGDERMGAYHISLYMALFLCWNRSRFRTPFPVDREELMQLSRIGSKNTYARCMKQLNDWGYIEYSPSGNFHTGRKVSCTRFDTGTGTGAGTRNDTGKGTRTSTRTSTRGGTPINNTNITNGNKQESSQIIQKEKGKKINGKSVHHVNTDKDYFEPL
ncbi:hypothetical protein [Maribellus maritimus]|uniref:hypothetical protein n=1 Tax=Maribellus maritimus TaxID=2870838 RepID=UPI001EEBC9A2|nr:hypothetical protein [Maribellus maritimus]MCG6190843.1 hypothetical protein [Maribellus maritimus]